MSVLVLVLRLVLLHLGCWSSTGRTFNLEPRIAILKEGPKETYFGFSVAQHQVSSYIIDSYLISPRFSGKLEFGKRSKSGSFIQRHHTYRPQPPSLPAPREGRAPCCFWVYPQPNPCSSGGVGSRETHTSIQNGFL